MFPVLCSTISSATLILVNRVLLSGSFVRICFSWKVEKGLYVFDFYNIINGVKEDKKEFHISLGVL